MQLGNKNYSKVLNQLPLAPECEEIHFINFFSTWRRTFVPVVIVLRRHIKIFIELESQSCPAEDKHVIFRRSIPLNII